MRPVTSSCSVHGREQARLLALQLVDLPEQSRMARSLASCVVSAAFSASRCVDLRRAGGGSRSTSSSVSSAPRLKNVLQERVALLLELRGDGRLRGGRSCASRGPSSRIMATRGVITSAQPSCAIHAAQLADERRAGALAQGSDVAAPGQEHRRAQLGLDGLENAGAPLRPPADERAQHGPRDARPRRRRARWRAATSRPRRDPARRDDRLEAERREERDRGRRGDAPVPERLAERSRAQVAARLGAPRLDADPRRAARPRDVDVPHAHLAQALAHRRREAAARLLDHDRHAELAHEARDGVERRARSRDRRPAARAPSPGSGGRRARRRPPRRRAPRTSLVVIARACTTPTLPRTSVVGATSRTRYVAPVPGRTCIARWLPRPKPYPRSSAMLASSRLMRPASSVPPVIAAMTSGARSFLPKSVTESVDVGQGQVRAARRARGARRSSSVERSRKPTSSSAQSARWSALRLADRSVMPGRTVARATERQPGGLRWATRDARAQRRLSCFKET